MLIILDTNLAEWAEKYNPEELMHLELLLSLHITKKHYVGTDKKTAKQLKKTLTGRASTYTLRAIDLIEQQSIYLGKLTTHVKCYCIIKYEMGAKIEREYVDGKIIWTMGLTPASNWLSQASKLYGENIIDGQLLLEAARCIISNIDSLNKHNINVQIDHTGGCGEAPKILKQKIKEASAPVFFFTDSDKCHANAAANTAVAECPKIISSSQSVAHFEHLEEREIENIFSTKLMLDSICKAIPQSAERDSIIENIRILETIKGSHPDLYKYIDIKYGTCKSWVEKHNLLSQYNGISITTPCKCKPDCAGQYTPPVCKNIIDHVHKYLEDTARRNNHIQFDSAIKYMSDMIISFSLCNKERCL